MNPRIEIEAERYADAHAALVKRVAKLKADQAALQREVLPLLKRLVAAAAEQHSVLHALIEAEPGAFTKPKTIVLHGIKLGFRKGSGGIDWDDDETVVKLIRKHFPDDAAAVLIKTTEKPIAKALEDLDVATLKKIGCRVEDTGDVVVIKPADSDVDKVVTALLKGATEEEGK